jgi:AbrB family looped-hinge helix DNA binding protein
MNGEETKFTVYIGNDGRITVPKEVRDALGIVKGDLVECTIRKVKMKPVSSGKLR